MGRLGFSIGGKRKISPTCFRILSLTAEVQNGSEILKPVLEELEVMRLSSTLGMLSSIQTRDFNYELLEPRDFDDDFTRFLKRKLHGTMRSTSSKDDQLKIVSLFGRQSTVKQQLQQMELWSDECEKELHPLAQGIYCIQMNPQESSITTLVFFSWLHDKLLCPQEIRGTATYILRFLTCLSSDVVCCMNDQDLQDLNESQALRQYDSLNEWQSFSVGFRVERQEDEKDDVKVLTSKTVRLDCAKSNVIYGDYPALCLEITLPTSTRFQSEYKHFTVHQFAKFISENSKKFNIELALRARDYQEALLRQMDCYPNDELKKLDQLLAQSLTGIEEKCKDFVCHEIEDIRAHLLEYIDYYFTVDDVSVRGEALPDESMELKKQEAYSYFKERFADIQSNNNLTPEIKKRLRLPLNVRENMANLYSFYKKNSEEDWKQLLEELPSMNSNQMEKKCSQSYKEVLMNKVKSIFISTSSIDKGFLVQLNESLSKWKIHWWENVEIVFKQMLESMWSKEMVKEKEVLDRTINENKQKILDDAFYGLVQRLATNPQHKLKMQIKKDSRSFGPGMFIVIEEVQDPPCSGIRMLKIDDSVTLTLMGWFRLGYKEKPISSFSVKPRSAVIVSMIGTRTVVKYVQFPMDNTLRDQEAYVKEVRSFPQQARLCAFNPKERTMAFVFGKSKSLGNLAIYRFSQQYTGMELMRSIDLNVRLTLDAPIKSLQLSDDTVYCIDKKRQVQSINLRTQDISQRIERHEKVEWRSFPVLLCDNNVLSNVALIRHDDGSVQNVLENLVIEDHRLLPRQPISFGKKEEEENAVEEASRELTIVQQCDRIFLLDRKHMSLTMLQLHITMKSDSFRIRQSNSDGSLQRSGSNDLSMNDHWLWAFYHVFEKFPVKGLIEKDSNNLLSPLDAHFSWHLTSKASEDRTEISTTSRQFMEFIVQCLEKLSKPLHGLDLALNSHHVWFTSGDDVKSSVAAMLKHSTCTRPTIMLVEALITFVPIQICRAESNRLHIMSDGQATDSPEQRQVEAVSLANQIRFGFLSPLLQSWQGPCVVISSMGKQSTGKSYFLNHLTGSSFAIAGERCTDGAWMSARILPNQNVMLIILDFEGLGSFERSEQEDVFLSVLNASVSQFTIFRMEMRFDKEIDDLFTKFQKGIQLIKGNRDLFQGILYLSVKDVNPNDQKGVVTEFADKIQKLVGSNREHNFLTELYNGQLEINSSPPLGTTGYYLSLMNAKRMIDSCILKSQASQRCMDGKAFMDRLRLVLAKISILDWTDLDETTQRFKLNDLRKKFHGMIRTGCICSEDSKQEKVPEYAKEPLARRNGSEILVQLESLSATVPEEISSKWHDLNKLINLDTLSDEAVDIGTSLSDTVTSKQSNRAIALLFELFLQCLNQPFLEKIEIQWQFDAFLSFIVARRRARIMQWLQDQNVLQEYPELEDLLTIETRKLENVVTRCGNKCKRCQLSCMLVAKHDACDEHSCGTDHLCKRKCSYCLNDCILLECSKEAGHEGLCECVDGDHTCREQCEFSTAPNCGKNCEKKRGHKGIHCCAVQYHVCGEECSALSCGGTCIEAIDQPHSVHKCKEVKCLVPCKMSGCSSICGAPDHFHGFVPSNHSSEADEGDNNNTSKSSQITQHLPTVVHMCSNSHVCGEICEEDGICKHDVQSTVSTKTFSGERGTFQYTYQEMHAERKKCTVRLLPGEQRHPGNHSCVSNKPSMNQMHFCTERCPSCQYYCNRKYGHQGSHSTSHGNMRQTYFLSDSKEIDLEDRKYRAGELGIAEMCNLFCSKMGRGHIHYVKCERSGKERCIYDGDNNRHRRHCNHTLEPKPSSEMDKVLHEEYWRTIGWKDPCTSSEERALFKMCPCKCDAPEHREKGKESFCMELAWHEPVEKPSQEDNFSYIDGHKFKCSHVSNNGKFHHVFVLDCSGSMNGQPWQSLIGGVNEYILNRIALGAVEDVVSVVTFDSSAQVEFEGVPLKSVPNRTINYRGGGTVFGGALREANGILSRQNFAAYKPVIVFFSDGHPHDVEIGFQVAQHIHEAYKMYDLAAFVVGYGSINLDVLKSVAKKLGGNYFENLTGAELKTTFRSIAISIGATTGLVCMEDALEEEELCVICQVPLDSTKHCVRLKSCQHQFHRECFETLRQQNTETTRPMVCPVCRQEM